jgi:hypothetical protein
MDTEKALDEVSDGIEQELNTILPGENPLDGLHAEHEGGLEYTVISSRNGAPSIHWVELGPNPSCTCSDYKGNKASGFSGEVGAEREPCSHIVKATLADTLSPDELATRELINTTATITNAAGEARQAAREAEDTARELDTVLSRMRSVEADTASSSTSSSSSGDERGTTEATEEQNSSSHSNADSARNAAEKLQKAFDSVIEGMAVEHNEGMVWVNKTPGAPDQLPGPGNIDVFEAFLQNPEQIQYVHDNHDYKGAEPGNYFNNMIEPSAVDDYITEVLE